MVMSCNFVLLLLAENRQYLIYLFFVSLDQEKVPLV